MAKSSVARRLSPCTKSPFKMMGVKSTLRNRMNISSCVDKSVSSLSAGAGGMMVAGNERRIVPGISRLKGKLSRNSIGKTARQEFNLSFRRSGGISMSAHLTSALPLSTKDTIVAALSINRAYWSSPGSILVFCLLMLKWTFYLSANLPDSPPAMSIL